MIYNKIFYSKKFYIAVAFIILTVCGGSLIFYTNHQQKLNNASYMLHKAISSIGSEEEEKTLINIAQNGISPYCDVASMQLASFYYNKGNKEKSIAIYKKVSDNSPFAALKQLAATYSSLITRDFNSNVDIYNFSYKFLQAASDIENEITSSAQDNLTNIKSAIDTNYYLKNLSARLLESLDSNFNAVNEQNNEQNIFPS